MFMLRPDLYWGLDIDLRFVNYYFILLFETKLRLLKQYMVLFVIKKYD